jgi:hypothetical protein
LCGSKTQEKIFLQNVGEETSWKVTTWKTEEEIDVKGKEPPQDHVQQWDLT